MKPMTKEVPLPSGLFARIGDRMTFGQRLLAWGAAEKFVVAHPEWKEYEHSYVTAAAIISVCVTLDDKKVSIQEVLDLDPRDGDALTALVAPYCSGPIKR